MEYLINILIDLATPLAFLLFIWVMALCGCYLHKDSKENKKKCMRVLGKISIVYVLLAVLLSATTSSNTYKNTTGYDRVQDVKSIQVTSDNHKVLDISDKTLNSSKTKEERKADFESMVNYK